jgi:hypothetical protein
MKFKTRCLYVGAKNAVKLKLKKLKNSTVKNLNLLRK